MFSQGSRLFSCLCFRGFDRYGLESRGSHACGVLRRLCVLHFDVSTSAGVKMVETRGCMYVQGPKL